MQVAQDLDMNYIARLVRQAQSGDSDAFAEFYVATCQRLYRFSCRYLQDKYLAQDALQETYIKALQHMNQLRDPTLAISWLGQINMRVCYHMLQRRREIPTEDTLLNRSSEGTAVSDPENQVVQVDYDQYLMKQILNLPFT